jgi:hypothetical protein
VIFVARVDTEKNLSGEIQNSCKNRAKWMIKMPKGCLYLDPGIVKKEK